MLDMSSAFDTIDHAILLQRFKSLGIKGTALDWFTSYLSERSQYVRIGNFVSGKTNLNYGVPQVSVGGPLFFSLFICNQSTKYFGNIPSITIVMQMICKSIYPLNRQCLQCHQLLQNLRHV